MNPAKGYRRGRRVALLALFASLVGPPALAESWDAEFQLTDNDVDDAGHLLVSDGTTILAAWHDPEGRISYVVATPAAPAWSPVQTLGETYPAHSFTRLGDGLAMTALRADGMLVVRRLRDGALRAEEALSPASSETTFMGNHPAGDADGNLWWPTSMEGSAPPYVLRRQRPGEAYADLPLPIQVSDAEQLGLLLLLPADTDHAWFVGFSTHRVDSGRLRTPTPYIYYSLGAASFDTGSWGKLEQVFPLTWPVGIQDIDAELDAAGRPVVVTRAQKDGMIAGDMGQVSVWITRRGPARFGEAERVSRKFQHTSQACLALDAAGRAHAVWQQVDEKNGWQAVYYAAEDADGLFGEPERVSPDPTTYTTLLPDVACFDDGSGVVLWSEFDGRDFDLRSRRWRP